MASVALLTITGMLSQAVGFAYQVGLTRLAGAEIMGLYQLILPVYSILLSLTSVGLTTDVSNLSAWYQALGDRRTIWQVRGQAIRLFFGLAALPCLLLLLFSDAISVYLLGDARTRLGLMLLVPCLLLTGVENLQKHYFYGTGRVFPAAITELAEMVLRAAALLGNLISSANAVLIPRLLVVGGMDQNRAVAVYDVTFGMTLPMLLLPTVFLSALGLVLTPKLSQCAALSWRVVARAIGLTLPVFPWFAAPVLASCLAAACGDLMETVLRRSGLPPPAPPCHPAQNPLQWQKRTTGRHRP